jgi:hypothetical protein
MNKQVELLAHQTLQKLTQKLLESPNAASLTKEEIIQTLTDVIQSDYKSCRKSLRQDFYKKLSRLLHSDRLVNDTQYKDLADYLNRRELLDEPQKTLNEYHESQSTKPIVTFFKDVISNPSQSLDILRNRLSDNPLISNIQRYPDSVKLGVMFLLVISLVGSSVITVLSTISSEITRSLINAINNLINLGLNKITDNRYEQMAELYKAIKFHEYKKQFLLESRKKIQTDALADNYDLYTAIKEMDDSDFWSYLLGNEPGNEEASNTSAEDRIHEKIMKSRVFTLDRMKSIFFALYAVGTDVNKSALERVTALIASPVVLTAVALGEAVSLAQSWFFSVVDAANMVGCYIVFTALNAPLISYDASVYLLEYLMDKDIVDHEVTATKVQKTPLYLLFDKPEETAEQSLSEVEPIHMDSPINSDPLPRDMDVIEQAENTLNTKLS